MKQIHVFPSGIYGKIKGMELRDYFAATALPHLLKRDQHTFFTLKNRLKLFIAWLGFTTEFGKEIFVDHEESVKEAYEIADEMIYQRNKTRRHENVL